MSGAAIAVLLCCAFVIGSVYGYLKGREEGGDE